MLELLSKHSPQDIEFLCNSVKAEELQSIDIDEAPGAIIKAGTKSGNVYLFESTGNYPRTAHVFRQKQSNDLPAGYQGVFFTSPVLVVGQSVIFGEFHTSIVTSLMVVQWPVDAKAQLKLGNKLIAEAAKGRGYTLHPRLAAQRSQNKSPA